MELDAGKRQILFIADDFGMSPEINAAIVRAHRRGALHGACLMMGQPGTADAIARASDNPSLQIGWHLHLNDSKPLTVDAWPWGRSPAAAGLAIGLMPRMRRLARREIDAQWEAFRQTGLPCRFINTHHNLHVHPVVRRQLVRLIPLDFSGWVRWGTPRFFAKGSGPRGYRVLDRIFLQPHRGRLPWRVSSTLWGIDRVFGMDAAEVQRVLPGLGAGLHEFVFHPRTRNPHDADTKSLLDLGRA